MFCKMQKHSAATWGTISFSSPPLICGEETETTYTCKGSFILSQYKVIAALLCSSAPPPSISLMPSNVTMFVITQIKKTAAPTTTTRTPYRQIKQWTYRGSDKNTQHLVQWARRSVWLSWEYRRETLGQSCLKDKHSPSILGRPPPSDPRG